jgi:hypothetical protein
VTPSTDLLHTQAYFPGLSLIILFENKEGVDSYMYSLRVLLNFTFVKVF